MDKWIAATVYTESTTFFSDDRFVLMKSKSEVFKLPTHIFEKIGIENLKMPFEIIFERPEVAKGKFVVGTLKEVADFIDNLVTKFEKLLV